jgi:hypothetical protein
MLPSSIPGNGGTLLSFNITSCPNSTSASTSIITLVLGHYEFIALLQTSILQKMTTLLLGRPLLDADLNLFLAV